MNDNWRPGRMILWIWTVCHSSEVWIVLVPPMSVKDCPLHWIQVRSQIYYSEHILVYGSGKARYAFVVGSGSFRTN